jgi:DNA-binding helix-hairpin-helix protein with protein kinase domain
MDFSSDHIVWSFVPPYPGSKVKVGHWIPLKVGNGLDEGGMAKIYKQPPWPASKTLIKLFKPGLSDTDKKIAFAKIRAMNRCYTDLVRELPVVAWPKSMVFSEQAERPDTLIGCTMPFFSNPTPLERIAVSLKSLRRLPALATADMDTMRRIAFNIINGFEGMHQQSMLFADPNANNILVDDTTLAVKFIDADSYAMSLPRRDSNGKVVFDFYEPGGTTAGYRSPYAIRCDRGKTSLSKYSASDDAYVLAIHIFTLLVPGFHPWHFSVPKAFECESNALEGRFPYAGTYKMAPCIQLSMFEDNPADIRDAFVAAFVHKTPPTATRWKELFTKNWRFL